MRDRLLDKYYKGETSLEEEECLKSVVLSEKNDISEKDIFQYYKSESSFPKDLENQIFYRIAESDTKKKIYKIKWFSFASAAATVLILLTIYLGFKKMRNAKIENDFFVMEQALLQVSQSIQPDEQEEMFILWVDDDVEIIIN